MKRKAKGGITSFIDRLFIRDTSVTTKVAGLTGLTNATAGLTWYWIRSTDATPTQVTPLVNSTVGTWSSGGFKEMSAANMPGWYEIGVPDAAMASGARAVGLHLRGAANMEDIPIQYELDAVDYQDATRFGLTALPNAASGSAGALLVDGTGTAAISNASGRVDLGKWLGVAPSVLDANNMPKVSLYGIMGSLLTGTGSQLAAAFSTAWNVVTGVWTAAAVNQTGDTFARIGVAGAGLTAVGDTAGTTTLLTRLTAARGGYLDNLNVGGVVASHADILAINQSASKHLLLVTVGQYESGEAYVIEMRTFAAVDGSAVNADTTPTITVTGTISGSLAANLGAITNPATGVYRATYTTPSLPTLEQIRVDGSATINSSTFTLSTYTQTVDLPTAVFTTTNQTHLEAIYNALPAASAAIASQPSVTALGSPMQAGSTVVLTTGGLTNAQAATIPTIGTIATTTSAVGSVTGNVGGSVGSVTGLVASNLDAAVSTRSTLAAGAQMDLVNTPNATAVTAISTGVWSATNRTLSAFTFTVAANITQIMGSVLTGTAAQIAAGFAFFFGVATPTGTMNSSGGGGGTIQNTITVPPAVAVASQNPVQITCLRGDTLRRALTTLGSVSARSKAWFTVKARASDPDSAALIQIVESVGITIFNGAPASDASKGSLTVDVSGIPTIYVDEILTSQTDAWRVWRGICDVQVLIGTDVSTPISGTFVVTPDVTRATS